MVKKYKQRLALWIFSVFLLAVLLPGCGRQNAPGKEAASLQERADIAALQTDGEAEETLPVKAAETEIIGSDETKSVQAGGGETEYPETGEDEIRTPDAVNAGTESADSESNGSYLMRGQYFHRSSGSMMQYFLLYRFPLQFHTRRRMLQSNQCLGLLQVFPDTVIHSIN